MGGFNQLRDYVKKSVHGSILRPDSGLALSSSMGARRVFTQSDGVSNKRERIPMAKKQNDLISFPMHLSREVERMFDEMIHRPWGFCRDIRGWNPSVDLYETDEAFVLEADLPGVKSEDFKVDVQDSELVLKGWRSLEKNRSDGQFHTMERSSGHFERRIKLPDSVQKDAIKADFTDGVLRVILPKVRHKRGEER
jgi:HSP20 family molecular chaperone IbpA